MSASGTMQLTRPDTFRSKAGFCGKMKCLIIVIRDLPKEGLIAYSPKYIEDNSKLKTWTGNQVLGACLWSHICLAILEQLSTHCLFCMCSVSCLASPLVRILLWEQGPSSIILHSNFIPRRKPLACLIPHWLFPPLILTQFIWKSCGALLGEYKLL